MLPSRFRESRIVTAMLLLSAGVTATANSNERELVLALERARSADDPLLEKDALRFGAQSAAVLTAGSKTGSDTVTPVLTSFAMNPELIDVTGASRVVTLSAGATDNESGLDKMYVWFDRPLPEGLRLSGIYSWSNGTGTRSITIPEWTPPGTYQVDRVELLDKAQNLRTYEPAELLALGFPTEFEVTGPVELTLPELHSFSIAPRAVQNSSANSVVVSASASDDTSGIDKLYVWFDESLPEGLRLSGIYSWTSGSGMRSIPVPQWSPPKTYSIARVELLDRAQNMRTYLPAELSATGFPTTFTVEGLVESAPPVLVDFSFSTTQVDVSEASAAIRIDATVIDDASGPDKLYVWFDKTLPEGLRLSGIYSWADGRGTRSISIPQWSPDALYSVSRIEALDRAQNLRTYLPAEIEAQGWPTAFRVGGSTTPDAVFRNSFE
jgi:hypothetical protein